MLSSHVTYGRANANNEYRGKKDNHRAELEDIPLDESVDTAFCTR